MSYTTTADCYIHSQYSMFHPGREKSTAIFSEKLHSFLSLHPVFSISKQHLEFLRYCYFQYINCDFASRGLPVQDKLKQPGEMANNFKGIVIGAKG